MKLLVPIILDVDPFGLPTKLDAKALTNLNHSIQTAIRNCLSSSQSNGFSHPLENDVSITAEIVGEAIAIQIDGAYKTLHEFDHEPTYVSTKRETKDKDIVLNAGIPHATRLAIASLIIPILNTTITPKTKKT